MNRNRHLAHKAGKYAVKTQTHMPKTQATKKNKRGWKLKNSKLMQLLNKKGQK